ncbi:hypothetical protein EMIHUDRAFT_218736 [Emiliania huxleyi CCMP1516]|uniref:Uncharacterized protein n=2 Tax=Emiliania huxleyi TaxID=2903 RepID=A0A0D3I6V3_EMIH1|nr:hypothetical protein EMIHUDRAFT_218736 [Emiliania huxleyi CCMP1516]EOD06988.1 hypothetical protein EMIHUDRAFT_218736 [Emiliania huxleyi CCMP1516]|eukprot:XP_005759417.1 hypothetical protein EMIHUDRAFT_218736 [Emiliania huxleyi CCMP1516]
MPSAAHLAVLCHLLLLLPLTKGVEFLPRRAFGQLSRRACLAAPLTAVAFGRPPTAAASGDLSAAAVSSGDDLAVISTARKLDGVLADWDAEIALGALQSSANLLQEDALKRLGAGARAAGGGAAGASFTQHKNAMLTYLFLVTGATKYEGAEKAAGTWRCIREALDEVARAVGIELASKPAAAASD